MELLYEFACPGCAAEIAVDETVQRELISKGCVQCEAPVSREHFAIKR